MGTRLLGGCLGERFWIVLEGKETIMNPRCFGHDVRRVFMLSIVCLSACIETRAQTLPTVLRLTKGWQLQSSAALEKVDGQTLSTPGYKADGWHTTTVPRTVLAALVDNGVYPDPYYGQNLAQIPGYKKDRWLRMDESSPFYPTWWYRIEFEANGFVGEHIRLHLDGINYRANVWLNGKKVAGDDTVVGMFRRFEFDVTELLARDKRNVLPSVSAPGSCPTSCTASNKLKRPPAGTTATATA